MLKRQVHTQVADSLPMASTIDPEKSLPAEDMATAPFGLVLSQASYTKGPSRNYTYPKH